MLRCMWIRSEIHLPKAATWAQAMPRSRVRAGASPKGLKALVSDLLSLPAIVRDNCWNESIKLTVGLYARNLFNWENATYRITLTWSM